MVAGGHYLQLPPGGSIEDLLVVVLVKVPKHPTAATPRVCINTYCWCSGSAL